jgi:membrane fusion protein (multidrug efflux system)
MHKLAALAPGAGAGAAMGLPVEGIAAVEGPIAQDLQVVGQVVASNGTELRSEVTGRVVKINFKDGSPVKAGTQLVVLDDSVQAAALAQAQANALLAQANVGRYQRLLAQDAASQLQVDQAEADAKVALANVQAAKANLAKMRIAAPFDGVAGIAQVNVGDYIQPGQLLVALTDNRELKMTFKVPESQATSLQTGVTVAVTADGVSGTVEGKVAALDGRVDPASRTLEGKVLMDNSDGLLVAGQFVRVTVPVRAVSDAVVIPDTALVPQGNNMVVWVVGEGNHVSPTNVQVGLRSQSKAQILSGIDVGQMVVTAGQQKLQPGMPVTLRSPTTIVVPPQAVEQLD